MSGKMWKRALASDFTPELIKLLRGYVGDPSTVYGPFVVSRLHYLNQFEFTNPLGLVIQALESDVANMNATQATKWCQASGFCHAEHLFALGIILGKREFIDASCAIVFPRLQIQQVGTCVMLTNNIKILHYLATKWNEHMATRGESDIIMTIDFKRKAKPQKRKSEDSFRGGGQKKK